MGRNEKERDGIEWEGMKRKGIGWKGMLTSDQEETQRNHTHVTEIE